jgi:HTH-type transcriptional regulator/antitoxin HigA
MEIVIIKTEADYKAALEEIERIFESDPRTADADRLMALATVVEAYEAKHYPSESSEIMDVGREMVQDLLDVGALDEITLRGHVGAAYSDGRITLREAAELLDLSLTETIDLFAGMGIKGNIRPEDLLRDK